MEALDGGKVSNDRNQISCFDQYIVSHAKKDELQQYINEVIDTATIKVREIKKIEKLLKTLLQYKGYNKRNLNNRIYRLDEADEISIKDKKLVREIHNRQSKLASELTDILRFILQLYDTHDEEVKNIKKELKEFVSK